MTKVVTAPKHAKLFNIFHKTILQSFLYFSEVDPFLVNTMFYKTSAQFFVCVFLECQIGIKFFVQ